MKSSSKVFLKSTLLEKVSGTFNILVNMYVENCITSKCVHIVMRHVYVLGGFRFNSCHKKVYFEVNSVLNGHKTEVSLMRHLWVIVKLTWFLKNLVISQPQAEV